MDSTLAALKRSARAVLQPELRRMRKELKEARNSAALFRQLAHDATERQRYADGARIALKSRLRLTQRWLAQERPADNGIRALVQWIEEGPEGPRANANGVHPFDRWQITPKPEDLPKD